MIPNEVVEDALVKVESIHHIHGDQCLCGFKSSISRDRTKHIMEVTLEAAAPHMLARVFDEGVDVGRKYPVDAKAHNPYRSQA